MLLELQVQDFALIYKLNLKFNQGLNILSGETGAGKSIIIDSVNFVLGERASKDIIRTDSEKTEVTAVFELIKNDELKKIMEEYGIDSSEDIIILSRELNISGRSICRINGKTVTTAMQKSIGGYLIDIHGQHEHQSLINEDYHIDVLDMFGGNELNALRNAVKNIYNDTTLIKSQLKSLMGDDIERERKLNLLDFQIKEIDDARLKLNEEEELLKQRTILSNAGKIFSVLSSSFSNLYEGENGDQSVYDRMGSVLFELRGISGLDEKIGCIFKSLEDAYYSVESAAEDIRIYRDKIEFNPELVNEIETRLDLINKLKRKYGKTIGDILNYRKQISIEKQDIENSEEKIQSLKKQLEDKLNILNKVSNDLSIRRKSTASKLAARIINELKFLGMEKSKFEAGFEILKKDNKPDYSEKGFDIVRFLISTNPGEPLKPLSKIASGGEISRIMLAIKTVLADTDSIPSLIFDEIDTGISGRAAQAVAEKLGQISRSHQIICVTHLPQIASMADTHFCISKEVISGKTKTSVTELDAESRIKEVARLLGGAKLTELTLKHAEEMTNMAQGIKRDYTLASN